VIDIIGAGFAKGAFKAAYYGIFCGRRQGLAAMFTGRF